MAVVVTISETQNGTGITSLDFGDSANGLETQEKTVYLRHDGAAEITDCELFVQQYSGTYGGDNTAANDLTEAIAWGDGTGDNAGGLQINMNAVGNFPTASWETVETGPGSASSAPITLAAEAVGDGTGDDGDIPAGSTNNRFKLRVSIPNSEDTLGTRQFRLTLNFDYTS